MSTSNQSTFSLPVWSIIDDAYERIGQSSGQLSPYDAITARRSLNLMIQDWINSGVQLWTMEQDSLTLIPGVAIYDLDDDTSDILYDGMIRSFSGTTPLDVVCRRIMRDEYLGIPNKTIQSRPIQFLLERNMDNPVITFWPVPDTVTAYQFIYYRIRYLQDIDSSNETIDLPRRFLPAAVAGLAHFLAQKAKSQVDQATRAEIKAEYDEALLKAQQEDRDRTSIYLRPDFKSGPRGAR